MEKTYPNCGLAIWPNREFERNQVVETTSPEPLPDTEHYSHRLTDFPRLPSP